MLVGGAAAARSTLPAPTAMPRSGAQLNESDERPPRRIRRGSSHLRQRTHQHEARVDNRAAGVLTSRDPSSSFPTRRSDDSPADRPGPFRATARAGVPACAACPGRDHCTSAPYGRRVRGTRASLKIDRAPASRTPTNPAPAASRCGVFAFGTSTARSIGERLMKLYSRRKTSTRKP